MSLVFYYRYSFLPMQSWCVMRSFDKDFPGFIKRKVFKKVATIKITLVLLLFFSLHCIDDNWGIGIRMDRCKNEFVRNLIGYSRWLLIILCSWPSSIFTERPHPYTKNGNSLLLWHFIHLSHLAAFRFSWWVSQFNSYNKLYGSIGNDTDCIGFNLFQFIGIVDWLLK